MRNFIFIYFLSISFYLVSSCSERKTAEEQETTTSSADGISRKEKTENLSSDNVKPDTLENNLSNNSSDKSSELSDVSEFTEPAESTEIDDISEAGENPDENDIDSLAEKDELQSINQEPFATVPPELSGKIVLHELPSKAAVGIRSYPDSYVISLNNKTKYRDKFYVTMELASSDMPEQVLDFYKNRRESWFYIENSAVHTFKKDKDKYFRETNTLQILPFDKNMYREIDSLLSFDAQTLIRIYYELPQQ